jgi:hypothetical protein
VPSLPTLLSKVLGKLTSEVEAAEGAKAPPLPVWANVLRCLPDAGGELQEHELPEAARISKRLATAAVTHAARAGWISLDPSKGKDRRLTLTDTGAAATQAWPLRLGELDSRWVGTPLRSVLEDVVHRLPLELPHFPASYGAADPSAIGSPYVQGAKRKEGELAHGTDWRPVPRIDDSVTSLPITALLSQTLMAFTIDYEDRFPWPLANTANVLVHIGSKPTPLKLLPPKHGISGKGTSLLERHLIVTVTKEGVALSDRGELVLKHHPQRLKATETLWRERFGSEIVDALRGHLNDAIEAESDHPALVMWSGGY